MTPAERKQLMPTMCYCDVPDKEYSKSGCRCCWNCKKCGKFGGCDNQIGQIETKGWEAGKPAICFSTPWAVYPKGRNTSLCYLTSKERADWLVARLNSYDDLRIAIEKLLKQCKCGGQGWRIDGFDPPEQIQCQDCLDLQFLLSLTTK
jgi:hypothetical protein